MAGMFDTVGMLVTWMKSGIFWLIVAVIITVCAVILLYVYKKSKLKYSCIELVSYGNGKVGINKTQAGTFKKGSAMFGLLDTGRESCFKTADGKVILEASTDDLHDIFGKKGFIVRRKDDDPKILVPISKIEWKNNRALFDIAPADFRDASVSIIADANKETQGWAEKYLPYVMLGGIVIFFVVSFILASQFFNRTVDKAGEILIKVGQNQGATAPSTAP
jgi:hypothetical protein